MRVVGAFANNLRDIDLELPSGIMTVITGVSGSGKTSLLDRVVYPGYLAGRAVMCKEISGFEHFSDLIYIEQPLPGKGLTASVGSMLGITDILARIFAGAQDSKRRRFKISHFTPGARDGRCHSCEGTGRHQVSMDFFTDAITPCEKCDGTGFSDEVLEIRMRGKTIWDTLQIPLEKIDEFWDELLPANKKSHANSLIDLLKKTGLGHLTPGRSLKTLSTGELQRLKLVSGLVSKKGDHTLILLDEPTGGLHPKDIIQLLTLFKELLDSGNTLVCVTHDPILIKAAGQTIELGPGGGSKGGRIIQ